MTRTAAIPILEEIRHLGVSIHVDAGDLVLQPVSLVPSDLAERVRRHKTELLKTLSERVGKTASPASPASPPRSVVSTERDKDVLADCSDALRARVDRIKQIFDATVIDVRPDPRWHRDRIAKLIKQARSAGDRDSAVVIRDDFRERLAIHTIEDGTPETEAVIRAADDVVAMQGHRKLDAEMDQRITAADDGVYVDELLNRR